MTDTTFEEAREAARFALEYPSYGSSGRIQIDADVLRALLAVTPEPPTTDEHLATMMDLAKRRWGGAQTRLAFEDGWTLSAGFRRPSPPTEPTVEEWSAAMDAERRRQIEHGYDDAHDQEHGAKHLLNWAIDYARRGNGLAAATMIREARDLPPSPPTTALDRHSPPSTTDDREARIALETMRRHGVAMTADIEAIEAALSATRCPSPPTEEQWEYGYAPHVGGHTWEHPETYSRAFVAKHPKDWRLMRRTKAVPAGPWEPVEAADRVGGGA